LYIVKNYLNRANWKGIIDFCIANKNYWISQDSEIDELTFSQFYLQNFDVFMNEDLFHRVVLEAREIFNVFKNDPLPDMINKDIQEFYYDYDGQFDGVNLLKLDEFELAMDYKNLLKQHNQPLYNSLTSYEKEHFDKRFIYMLSNVALSEQIRFIERTINDISFTSDYKALLLSYLNELRFLNSGDIYIPPNTIHGLPADFDTSYVVNDQGRIIATFSYRTTAGLVVRYVYDGVTYELRH